MSKYGPISIIYYQLKPKKLNKLKSLKVAQSKDDNYGCKDDIYGVVDGCDVVCDVMCDVVCDVVCDDVYDGMYGGEGVGKVE